MSNVRNCGFKSEDIELEKIVSIGERLKLNIGTMWSNALNRHPWNSLNTNMDVAAAFGTYTAVYPARNIQFFMKLEF